MYLISYINKLIFHFKIEFLIWNIEFLILKYPDFILREKHTSSFKRKKMN